MLIMASTKEDCEEDLAVLMLRKRTAFAKLPHHGEGSVTNEEATGETKRAPACNDSVGYTLPRSISSSSHEARQSFRKAFAVYTIPTRVRTRVGWPLVIPALGPSLFIRLSRIQHVNTVFTSSLRQPFVRHSPYMHPHAYGLEQISPL